VKWAPDVPSLGKGQVSGLIFSNEFLDALPTHRLVWSAARQDWQEACVGMAGEALMWELRGVPAELAGSVPQVPAELAKVLPDGFKIEICPAAAAWWQAAASSLRRGKLLTLDYGLTSEQRFEPRFAQGTLRAFARHHAAADLLHQPGGQDLTAHVNFSDLTEAGRAAGLRTERLTRQGLFLTEIMVRARQTGKSLEPWDSIKTRQFQTLTHPEHLGHKFQVLVQAR
jgi:SAM-dependent MidA family methyltransferase